MKPGYTGITRIVHATRFSLQGLGACWRHESAFRQEAVVSAALVPLGLWLGTTGVERALLIASILLVLIVELINSAVEAVIDRFGGEEHPLSGRAKDVGSAAVMLSLVLAAAVWGLVLWSD